MLRYELARQLATKHGIDRDDDVQWAIVETVKHLQDYPSENKRKRPFRALVKPAAELVDEWLTRGHDFAVDPSNIDSLLLFVRSHAPGCVWAVLMSKKLARKEG